MHESRQEKSPVFTCSGLQRKTNHMHIKHSQILILFQVIQNMSLPSRHANMKTTAKTERGKRTETFVCFDWQTNNTKYVFTFTACKYENCIFFFSEKGNKNYFLTRKTGFLISKDRDFCLFCLLGERLRLIDIACCQKKKVFWSPFNYPGYCN